MLGVTFDGLASYLRGRRNTSLRGTETGDKHWPNDNLFSAASLPLVYLSTTTFCANLVRMAFSPGREKALGTRFPCQGKGPGNEVTSAHLLLSPPHS